MSEQAGVDCQHDIREKRPSRLGDMRYNPEADRVEAPVLEFAWVCTACGKELE